MGTYQIGPTWQIGSSWTQLQSRRHYQITGNQTPFHKNRLHGSSHQRSIQIIWTEMGASPQQIMATWECAILRWQGSQYESPEKSFDQLTKILACIQKVPSSSPSGKREEFEKFRGFSQIHKKKSSYIKLHHNITHSLHCDYNNLYIPTNTNKVYKIFYILC